MVPAIRPVRRYLELQRKRDPTSRRLIPMFRRTVKSFCRVTVARGEAEGAHLALLRLQ